MIDESEICKSCGKRFIEHVGVIGTCAKLQQAIKLLDEARKAIQYSGLYTPDASALVTDKIHAFLEKVDK